MRTFRLLLTALVSLGFGVSALADAPAAPTDVTATTNDTEYVRLTWSEVPGAAYYVVYRYGSNTSQIGLEQFRVTGTSFDDTSCEAGVKIPYRVRAIDASGAGGKYSAYVKGFRKVLLEPTVGGICSVNPLGSAGVANPLKVRCNYKWQARADSWIILHKTVFDRSNVATNLAFSLTENNTGAPRFGTITLQAGLETATLNVIQGVAKVPGYPTWCGDSAYAVIEDAALPETFKFRPEHNAGFVAVPDDTAVGGSCLMTTAMTVGDKAVVVWTLPANWRLRFSWRKDTENARDDFALFCGTLDAEGRPDLASATRLETCSSTDWTQVSLDQVAGMPTNLFFVYEKKSGGTASTASGFAYLDNILLQTAPKSIRFLDPPVKYDRDSESYSLYVPTFGSRTVTTEVTFGHNVTLGGVTRPATGIIYPDWVKLRDFWDLKIKRGEGQDINSTVFSYEKDGKGSVDVRASYTIGTATASEILTINYAPSGYQGLDDCVALRESDVGSDWQLVWGEDCVGAVNGNAAASGTLAEPDTRVFSGTFSGYAFFRFKYKIASLADDESFTVTVDGIELPATYITGDDWQTMQVYVPSEGEHEIVWTFAKTGNEEPGSGVLLDDFHFLTPHSWSEGDTMLMRSVVVDNAANSFGPVYVATPTNEFSLATTIGADWIDSDVSDGTPGILAFDVAPNETGSFRSGQVRLVSGSVTNYLRVIQSATDSAEVSCFAIEPKVTDVAADAETRLYATFTLGGVEVNCTPDFDFYDDNELIEGGVLYAPGLAEIRDVDVSAELGVYPEGWWRRTYLQVTMHPSPTSLIPDGVTLVEANGWWVDADDETGEMYLQTDASGNQGTLKVLSMTVTGPGVFTCQGRQNGAGFYLDGMRQGGSLGGPGEWVDGSTVEVPAGEHQLIIEYVKTETDGTYRDIAAIRRLSWTPVEYAGVTLEGPTTMFGGGRTSYSMVKHFTNETAHVGWDETLEHYSWSTTCTVTGADSRTEKAVKTDFNNGQIVLTVALSMSWTDTLTLTVTTDDDGTPRTASIDVAVTPTDLGSVLDNDLPGFSIPYKSSPYVSASIAEDPEAVGGSCLELRTDVYSSYHDRDAMSELELQVMDTGVLTFNYKLEDGNAKLTVSVDGEEPTSIYLPPSSTWTPTQVEVTGFGPHRIRWAVERNWKEAVGSIDNVQWTQGQTGVVTGAEVYLDEDGGSSQTYRFRIAETIQEGAGARTETYDLAPDAWSLEVVSGDEEAVWFNPMDWNGGCEVCPSETILEKTTCRLTATCTFAGVTHVGETLIAFDPRVAVEDAIFDSGRYETLMFSWADGWSGSFDDHSAGTSCAKTETAAKDETRAMYVNLFGKGTLEFDWKLTGSSGNALDFCERTWDEKNSEDRIEVKASATGPTPGWQHVTVTFGDDEEFDESGRPINHECFWRYAQNGDNVAGGDFAWVDNVTWSGTTPPQIDYGIVTVSPDTLAPGESGTASVAFYRARGNEGGEPEPATGSDVPQVTDWNVINCEPPALAGYVRVTSDKTTGMALVEIDPACPYSGSCELLPSYTLYGEKNEWNSGYLTVTAGSKKAASAPKALGAPTRAMLAAPSMRLMAANGLNTVGECLLAGLDPEDPDDKLTVYVTMSNGVPHITWSPNLPDRTYVIKGKASLGDPAWVAPTNSTHRFFKVEIVPNEQ